MSPRVPPLRAEELVAILKDRGFLRVKQEGSHLKLRNAAGIVVIIPMHKGKTLPLGLLRQILKDAGLDPNDLRE